MSGVLPFTYIPPNLAVPLFYVEFDNSQAGALVQPQQALIIGQGLGSFPSGMAYVPSVASATGTYGAGSLLAGAIAAYRENDPVTPLYAMPLADAGAATAAAGSIALSGTATGNGTLNLYIAGEYIGVGVTSGQAAATVATAVAAAINGFVDQTSEAPVALPVTATVSTGTVTVTAANKGTLGNSIPILLNYLGSRNGQYTPAGLTVTITAMTGGATDPDLTSLATTLGSTPFDFINSPYTGSTQLASTSAMMNDQAGRWSYTSQLFGHVFSAKADTAANLLSFGATVNDQHLSVLGVESASPTPPHIWGAALMGALAPALQADPARPEQTLPIAGVLPAPLGSRFNFTNDQSLLTTGIARARTSAAGAEQIMRCVTTYQTNKYGQADQSYMDVTTPFSLMLITRTLRADITAKFGRCKLADDGTRIPAGSAMVTPMTVRNELIMEYAALANLGVVDDADLFAANLIVQRNALVPTRLDVLFPPHLVSGLRIWATLNQFRLAAA